MTIRAFKVEERFHAKNLDLIDTNASPFFHSFAANEWLIQRLETLSTAVVASSALCMVLLPPSTFSPGAPSSSLTFSRAVDAFDLQPSGRCLRPSAVDFFLQSSSSSTFSGRLLPSVVVVVVDLQRSSSSFSRHRRRPSAVVFFLQSSSSSPSFSCRRRLRPSAVTTSSISRGGIYSHRDQFLQPSL
ncbi:hypothetical protein LWI28_017838 [Acer negundo]|uniref:Uncharacterized protein n=1 Tax=Acer negundo TaxID=4023 RepID=A0AAD5IFM5_ACENE|nr:hypothetical protein LWI28_017838 [Acer negundo]